MPSAIASAVTAMPFRASEPPKKPDAEAARRARESAERRPRGSAAPAAHEQRRDERERDDDEPDGGEPEERKAVDRPAREERGREHERDAPPAARAAAGAGARRPRSSPARIAGDGATRVASTAGRSVARSDAATPTDGRGEDRRSAEVRRRDLRAVGT